MRLVDFSVRRPVAISMAFAAVLVFGFVSFERLDTDLLPDLSFPTITVETDYDEVGPREIENLISRPIEEAVGVVQGVEEVTSRSRPGRSEVTVTFRWGTDMDLAAMDVRERLDLINLPADAGRPTIVRYDPGTEPVVRFALTPDRHLDASAPEDREELVRLRVLAEEQVRRGLEGIEGVAAVRVTGGLEEEIHVEVDEQRLAGLGLSFQEVVSRLGDENINLAGGIVEEEGAEYVVRTVNEFVQVEEMERVVVGRADNTSIYLGDVAEVRREGADRETISRVNGAEAVEVAILRESTANIVDVADAVAERVDELEDELPAAVSFTPVSDQSTFIRSAVRDVQWAVVIGGLLAMLVLLVFLRHLPTTLIIATAIPISVVATFILMFSRDISLNIMSLGGLALGIGMLVDSAIVVLESIAKEREGGATPKDAARVGTARVGMAVVAATFTTVAVFLPIVFVEGVAGQLFGDQAWTVSFALISALVVSLSLIPMLASRGGGARTALGSDAEDVPSASGEGPSPGRVAVGTGRILAGLSAVGAGVARGVAPVGRGFDRAYRVVADRYPGWLRSGLERTGWILGAAAVLLAGSALLIPRMGLELVPELGQGELVVEMEAAPGTSLERMEALTRQAEDLAAAVPGVHDVFATVGVRGGGGTIGRSGEEERHASTLLVRLDPEEGDEDRVRSALGDGLRTLPGISHRVDRPRFFTLRTPLEVEVRGFELETLSTAARQVREELGLLPEIAAVDEERRGGNPEVNVRFDRQRLARAGLTVGDAAEALQARIRGASATEFTERDRDINVLVRAREDQRRTVESLGELTIRPPNGESVPLEAVATLNFQEGPAEIVRRGGSRVALVEAQPAGRDLGGTIERVEERLAGLSLPPGTTVRVAGQSRDLSESLGSMQLALLLAVFLVYLVMASQFESFRQPGIILVSVPLALPGAVGALWLTGLSISVVALIGMVMLVGIVVNNAIVLVDYINQLRRRHGFALDDAVVEGARARLRPIVLSTLTTVLGLLPLALIPGPGSELRVPLAVPVVGGLLLATLLTLFIVPALYRLFEARTEARLATAGSDGPWPGDGEPKGGEG